MKRFASIVLVVASVAAVGGSRAGLSLPSPADSQRPQWLPDGHRILFQSNLATHGFTSEPFVASDQGSGLRAATLSDRPAHLVDRSPDGSRVAYIKDRNLYVSGTDGSNAAPLTSDGRAYGDGAQPVAWSPDGTRIAFACCLNENALRGVIETIRLDGTGRHTVHRGTSVAWITNDQLAIGLEGYSTDVFRVNADGRHARPLITGYYSPGGFDLSPDHTQIAFSTAVGFAYDSGRTIYAADSRGTDLNVRRVSPDVCTVEAKPVSNLGGRCYDGTSGDDAITGTEQGDLIISHAGDDTIRAGAGENIIQSQWGADSIRSGQGPDFISAGSGNDTVRSGAGNDSIRPGAGQDTVDAGKGYDHILANDGQRDLIDCGPGDDRVRADPTDALRNCEHITYKSPRIDQGP